MTDADSRRAINEAINSLKRFVNSRQLDALHAARSGVPLNLVAVGVLYRVITRGPIRPTELAEIADIQPAALSRQIRILEDGGFIVRVGDAEDGRVSLVEATPAGRAAHADFAVASDSLLMEQLKGWTAEELSSLAEQMQRLVADLRGVRRENREAYAAGEESGGREDREKHGGSPEPSGARPVPDP